MLGCSFLMPVLVLIVSLLLGKLWLSSNASVACFLLALGAESDVRWQQTEGRETPCTQQSFSSSPASLELEAALEGGIYHLLCLTPARSCIQQMASFCDGQPRVQTCWLEVRPKATVDVWTTLDLRIWGNAEKQNVRRMLDVMVELSYTTLSWCLLPCNSAASYSR